MINRFLLPLCAALLASPASAQVIRPMSAWPSQLPAAAAQPIRAMLMSDGFTGDSRLVGGLRSTLEAPGAPDLVPLAEALAAQGVPAGATPTMAQFQKALKDSVIAIYAGAGSLLSAKAPADSAGWAARAHGMADYTSRWERFMEPASVDQMRAEMGAALLQAARFRTLEADAEARRMAAQLNPTREAEPTPGAASEPAPLARSAPRNAGDKTREPAAPAPVPPAPKGPSSVTTAGIYVGGAIVLTAMAAFLATVWATVGAGAALAASAVYLAGFAGGAVYLDKRGPSSFSKTLAVLASATAPVALVAALSYFNADFDLHTVRLAVSGTALAGAVLAMRRFGARMAYLPAAAASIFVLLNVFSLASAMPGSYQYVGRAAQLDSLIGALGYAAMFWGAAVLSARTAGVWAVRRVQALSFAASAVVPIALVATATLLRLDPASNPVGLFVWAATAGASWFSARRFNTQIPLIAGAIAGYFGIGELSAMLTSLFHANYAANEAITAGLGAAAIGAGYWSGLRPTRLDYARWIYMAGAAALMLGLTAVSSTLAWPAAALAFAGLALAALGAKLDRPGIVLAAAPAILYYLYNTALGWSSDWGVYTQLAAFGASTVAVGGYVAGKYSKYLVPLGLLALLAGGAHLAFTVAVLPKILFALAGAGVFLYGAANQRSSFTGAGALAMLTYAGYLLWALFAASLFGFVAMGVGGVGVIGLFLLYQKHAATISDALTFLYKGKV